MASSQRSLLHRPTKSPNSTLRWQRKKRGAHPPKFYTDPRQGIVWYDSCTKGADAQLHRRTNGSWKNLMLKVEPPQTPQGFKRLTWVDVIIQPSNSSEVPKSYTYTEVGGDDFLEKSSPESTPCPPRYVENQPQNLAVTEEEEEDHDELEAMSAQGLLLPRADPPMTWGCQSGLGVAYNCCECQVVTYKEWGLAKCSICGHLVCEICTEI